VIRIAFEIPSSCIYTPLPAFLEVFETVLEITFWILQSCCVPAERKAGMSA
jgi:hypothetical protein